MYFRTSFANALASIQAVLEFIERDVLKNNDEVFSDTAASKQLNQLIQKLDADISKTQTARREAKYEIVVSYYRPTWYKSFATTLDSLSRYLYGFALTVEREGQIILQQRLDQQKGEHSHDDNTVAIDMEELFTVNSRGAPNYYTKGSTVLEIEYKLISRLQHSVQPNVRRFIQICISVIQCIQYRLETNKAIPKKKQGYEKSEEHLDMAEAMKSLQEAKITLENEYQQRSAVPVEDHFMIYTILFTLTQFGNKLIELEEQANNLVKRKTGKHPHIFFPRVPLSKWLEEAGESAKGERTATEQVLFDQQHLLQREETRRNQASSSNQTERNREKPIYKPNGPIENRMSIESDWVDDQDNVLIPLQNTPGTHFWSRYLQILNGWLRTDPVRFAIKFTITMELLALMAWLPVQGANDLYNVRLVYIV